MSAVLRRGLRDQTPDAEVFGIDEALARIATQLMEAGDRSVMSVSDVTPEEIFGLSYVLMLSNKIGSDLLEDWVKNFLKLRISRLRLGRKELILLGAGATDAQRRGKQNVSDLFAGLGTR